jgi:hypothetical protein
MLDHPVNPLGDVLGVAAWAAILESWLRLAEELETDWLLDIAAAGCDECDAVSSIPPPTLTSAALAATTAPARMTSRTFIC